MKVLVAYMSQTGNTKKVADAIYGALPEPREIKPIKAMISHFWGFHAMHLVQINQLRTS
jgi:flavodoxin